jgi:hypothetical protein
MEEGGGGVLDVGDGQRPLEREPADESCTGARQGARFPLSDEQEQGEGLVEVEGAGGSAARARAARRLPAVIAR